MRRAERRGDPDLPHGFLTVDDDLAAVLEADLQHAVDDVHVEVVAGRLGLELLEEFVGRELGRQDVGLALDGGEIAGTELIEPRQAPARGVALGVAAWPASASVTNMRSRCSAVSGLKRILKAKRRSAAWSMRSIRLVVQTNTPSWRSICCSISLTSVTS